MNFQSEQIFSNLIFCGAFCSALHHKLNYYSWNINTKNHRKNEDTMSTLVPLDFIVTFSHYYRVYRNLLQYAFLEVIKPYVCLRATGKTKSRVQKMRWQTEFSQCKIGVFSIKIALILWNTAFLSRLYSKFGVYVGSQPVLGGGVNVRAGGDHPQSPHVHWWR